MLSSNDFRKMLELPKAKKKSIKHLESELQQACVKAYRLKYRFPHLIFAIPNGGKRGGGKMIKDKSGKDIPLEAIIMKREGVVAGVADTFVMSLFNNSAKGLFLETKDKGGTQSKEQKEFEKICIENGYNYAIYTSLDQFLKIVKDFHGY